MYDGLILIISCHGVPGYLCMSDYQLYSKLAIHRTFSFFANCRTIPRFVLFDCCSGSNSKQRTENILKYAGVTKSIGDEKYNVSEDQTKAVEVEDIFSGTTRKGSLWKSDEENPDHLLTRINAANEGFTSSLNNKNGSHLIYKFYTKYCNALDSKERIPYMNRIFGEIQTELQNEGKQLPECVYNDQMEGLIFKPKKMNKNGKQISGTQIIIKEEGLETTNNATLSNEQNTVEMVETCEPVIVYNDSLPPSHVAPLPPK